MKFNESSLYNIQSSVLGERRSLYELANWKNGIAFKKINFSDTGVPVIKIAELNNGIGGTTAYTQQIFSEDVHLKRGDLLFSWSGNPQTSIDIFRFKLEEGWLNQHIFKITPYEEIVDRDFFYFLMKNLKPYFTQIAINKQTTGLGHVTIADIKKISIVIPSLDLQREIVSYIKPIDDKIELNNEINNNLVA
ncbi:restriction endonuclease subunit S [Aminicella lysinilytica]|uniref:Type I restriction modification DNA specificity protein n=1 Tax=Aminicella lysinilytica TaxID=433323 RepID=A0A4V3CRD6_9FIRM|nr:restriction endonuclease subunit S [Aminicella lysinilytica]TDP56412.1 type I restriction modification DNA specificity protein [Aminicella lysinilytica]